MATSNEQLRDAIIRHQIMVLRYARSVEVEVLSVLSKTDAAVIALLLNGVDEIVSAAAFVDLTRVSTLRKLVALEAEVLAIRAAALEKVYSYWLAELGALAVSEAEFVAVAVRSVSPVLLDITVPRAAEMRALVAKVPVQGFSAQTWLKTLGENDARRVMQAVRVGLANGRSVASIAQTIRGTRAAGFKDGVLQTTWRESVALVRTLVLETANEARSMVVQANADILSVELYVATLDSRTTPQCRALDGQQFPIGQGPRPPVHWQCRSTRVPVINGEVLGVRPSKPDAEALFLKDYATENGLASVRSRSLLPHGHKTKYDQWRRRRVREVVGTVPAKTSYGEWLSKQSARFQDEVLGPTRGALFRRGGLKIDRFVDDSGRSYTLPELARRDREAFRAAGLDPADFGASAG